MSLATQICSPFTPSEHALQESSLPDKAVQLTMAAAKLAGRMAPETKQTLVRHMAVINSYYSNLIEGNRTLPHEIRAAQEGEFSEDPAKRDLQLESLAHIKVQQWIEAHITDLDTLYQPECIQAIHKKFYSAVPESLHELKDRHGEVIDHVVPGQWRTRAVSVGQHVAPDAESIPELMQNYCEVYHPKHYQGDRKLIAVMCAHHRFAWLHPFANGNGRVMRLLTDTALKLIGLESQGVWCLSQGLARDSTKYKAMLAKADSQRAGDLDGRGQLSEVALISFCEFMLATAMDQVMYISELLDLDGMQERIAKYIQARNNSRIIGLGKIKDVAALVIYTAYVQGKLRRTTALELCGMPERSARRLLAQLKEDGLLSEISSRSDLFWEIPEHAEPWYFPQLTPAFE